jgi:hypothetical protein
MNKQIELLFEFEIPEELSKIKDKIISSLKSSIDLEIRTTVDRYKYWYDRDQKILNCIHSWKTSYERTSAYDSEYITRCTKCGCEEDTYDSICKKYNVSNDEITL